VLLSGLQYTCPSEGWEHLLIQIHESATVSSKEFQNGMTKRSGSLALHHFPLKLSNKEKKTKGKTQWQSKNNYFVSKSANNLTKIE
jgi:hypothetical protein